MKHNTPYEEKEHAHRELGCHRHHEDRHHEDRHHAREVHQEREGHGRGHSGGMRGRARRGEARYILLDALRDGPKHGYEIIKSLDERSGGQYSPSPGTVYPTMQYLEEAGLVRADQSSERRVFHLTEAGLADLEAHAQEIADFWERFAAMPSAALPESGFLREEIDSLTRTVREGLRGPVSTGDTAMIRNVRLALERCRNEIREIVSSPGSGVAGN